MLHSHTPYRLLSDERLARLASGRDARAFSLLYQRHERSLLAYCRSITRDPEDARDALQSAMAAAFAALPGRAEGTAPVRAWLFRIAHNESVNVLRRRRVDLPLVDSDLTIVPSAAEQTTERETAHEALAEVAQLPPRQRGALVLRELHGLDYGEIAAALSVTEVNARQLVFAARTGVADSRAGAALPCDLVRDAIEAGDRRAQRRRPLRAHLRSCDDCRAYARVSHVPSRRAVLALPGGWVAGWTQLFGGGAAPVSGSAELFTPAKAVALVAIAAAATGAATREHERAHATAKPQVASASHVHVRHVRAARRSVNRAVSSAAATVRPAVARAVAPARTIASATPVRTIPAVTPTPSRATRPSGGSGRRLHPVDRSAPRTHAQQPTQSAPRDPVPRSGGGDGWHSAASHPRDCGRGGADGSGSVAADPIAGDGDHPLAARVDGGDGSGQVAALDGGDQLGVGGT